MPPSRRGWTSFGSDIWLTAGSIGRLPDPDIPGKGTPLFNLCRDLTTGARRVSGCRDTIRGCVPQSDLRPDVRRLGGAASPAQVAGGPGGGQGGWRARGLGCPTLG